MIFDAEPSAELYEQGHSAPTEVVRIRFCEEVTWIHQTIVKMPSKMEKSKSFAREEVMTTVLKAGGAGVDHYLPSSYRFTIY